MNTRNEEGLQRGLFRDFTNALGQQMFFWGRDVIHSSGNLLCEFGLEREKSGGLDGTSCYRMEYEGDIIELHGACVGRYSRDKHGFLYIRNRSRCFLYTEAVPPNPGFYHENNLRSEPVDQLHNAGRLFLKWWVEYENWISETTSSCYRENCFRAFPRLPKSKAWMEPQQARKWLHAYHENSTALCRAREWGDCGGM
ncbi:MAG: hypothetical protein P1V20_13530 [Verrucomicrobiales bacterium]|nr:hypothetical protein [Verrucomicrobiales bacterium]